MNQPQVCIPLSTLFFWFAILYAQGQAPCFSQFFSNCVCLNPAYAGFDPGGAVAIQSREQWFGMSGSKQRFGAGYRAIAATKAANVFGTSTANDTFALYEGPSVAFQLERDSACAPAVVKTTNTSSGTGLGYHWSASGPGRVVFSSTTEAEPTLTFPDSGRYVITLAIGNPCCDSVRVQDTILILQPPTVALAPIPDACGQARFTPKATYSALSRIASVSWSFPVETGAVSGSSFFPGEQVIGKTGTYSVKVRVSNRCGEAEAAQRFSILTPMVASAQLSADTICGVPAKIQVTNTSEGDKLNFKWTVFGAFADKVVFAAALRSPEMSFRDTGVYIIQQEVFNSVCGSSTWKDTVSILTAPMPVLLGQDRFCEKASLTPQVDYLTYRVDSVRWDFTGGTPAFSTERKPAGIRYGESGEYRYTMTAFNYCGSAVVSDTIYIDTVPALQLGPTDTICLSDGPFRLAAAQPAGGTWLDVLRRPGVVTPFGLFDPVKARGGVSKLAYQYTAGACTASAFKEVQVVDLSYVDAGPDLNTCISDSLVLLKGGTPRGGWYRGPGVADTLAGQFSPRLLAEGSYTLTYTYRLPGTKCTQSDPFQVFIRPLPAPVLELGPLSGCPPHRITLQNKTPNADTYYYAWDFGDGRSVVGQDPGAHTYAKTGEYTVSLRAVDRFGCTKDTAAGMVRVFPEPEAQFAPVPRVPCGIPQQLCMQNLSKGADAYLWDFGNDSPSSDVQEPCATYIREGSYRVRLIARNRFLCSDTLEKNATVYDRPIAQAAVAQPIVCAEGQFPFTNRSIHADWVRWIFPEGKTDTAWSPLLRLARPGMYSVTLVAGNGSGCRDTLLLKDYLQVLPAPRAGMRVEKDLVAPPGTYWFIDDSSPDATRYAWDLSEGLFSSQKNVLQRYISRFDREIRHWVSNEQGCADTVRYLLDLDTLGGLFVPNTLEPAHRSAERQLFTPKGIGLESWHIALYTRGGQLVWESTELDKEGSPMQSWDGMFLGEEMPAGVYVWKVHYARFIDGSYWGGMPDEKGRPQKSGVLYLLR